MYIIYGLGAKLYCTIIIQGETELSFRLIPSLTQSHTKSHTKTVREEGILAKEGISLKDNSVSYCTYVYILLVAIVLLFSDS